jgi:NAD(P)-dependent dehydrogenase (short-subunit alcohol dehydrogenase family)
MDFKDKVVLITGASSGIGKATALAFAQRGAKVVVADVSEQEGQQTMEEVKGKSADSIFVTCNVADSGSVQNMVRQTVERFGRIDVAVNNAGIGGASAHTDQYPEEEWHKVTAVNLTGVFLCMKYELQEMLKAKQGCIINNASILGLVGFMGSAAYVAAKHGVVGLTQTAALEYAPLGIRVNAVCPGFIETPMLHDAGLDRDDKLHQAVANMHAMKRMGRAEEIPGAFLWLASEHASFVTGLALTVDGGYTAQ